jgi:protein-L-isoaspartate(D-aspartate) O-methyltransferase
MAPRATDILNDLQIVNVAVVEGALAEGQANQGPYDVILINGAVETVPQALLDQLKDGGRLVTVMQENGYGRAMRFIRSGGVVGSTSLADLSAPLLGEFLKPEAFVF